MHRIGRRVRASHLAMAVTAAIALAAGCQSAPGAALSPGTAEFRCGPTDDVELVISVATPPSDEGPPSRLTAVIGSEQWQALARGERRLLLEEATASQWCRGADAGCEAPQRLVFAFTRADVQDGGHLDGSVEIHLTGARIVHLPVQAPVVRRHPRCG
jgi:hypothetical protein